MSMRTKFSILAACSTSFDTISRDNFSSTSSPMCVSLRLTLALSLRARAQCFGGGADVVDDQDRALADTRGCGEDTAHIRGAIAARQRRLRASFDALAQHRRLAPNPEAPAEGAAEELGLVVAALAEFGTMHRNRNDRVKIDIAPLHDRLQ